MKVASNSAGSKSLSIEPMTRLSQSTKTVSMIRLLLSALDTVVSYIRCTLWYAPMLTPLQSLRRWPNITNKSFANFEIAKFPPPHLYKANIWRAFSVKSFLFSVHWFSFDLLFHNTIDVMECTQKVVHAITPTYQTKISAKFLQCFANDGAVFFFLVVHANIMLLAKSTSRPVNVH